MAKPKVRKAISEAQKALAAMMREGLGAIGLNMVDQIMGRLERLTPSQRLDAVKNLDRRGQSEYKKALLAGASVIAYDALQDVRKEVPGGKSIQLAEGFDERRLLLGEFDDLPAPIRAKVKAQQQLMVTTQLDDLEKQIAFQFSHSIDSTDSMAILRKDLTDAVEEYLAGPRIGAGAGAMAAQITNETRASFLDTEEAQAQIEAFIFENADPVSPICEDLAGTIFAKDDPDRFRYTPPLHFNCKSFISPILNGNLKGREITKLEPSTAKLKESIQFSERAGPCSCVDHSE